MFDLIITVLFGWLGVHKFIKGKIGIGILYLLTMGLFGIGWFVDSIIALINYIKSRNSAPAASNYEPVTSFEVAGMPFVKDDIASIMSKNNPKYSDFVYRVREDYATLKPEPTNPHDHNAIAIYVDDVRIGYVPAVLTRQIRPLIGKRYFYTRIYGGDRIVENEIIESNFKGLVNIE